MARISIQNGIFKKAYSEHLKAYHWERFKKAGELVNNTLVKDGIMPKVHRMYELDGRYFSEQELLTGYSNCIALNEADIDMPSFRAFARHISAILIKHELAHNDIHAGNVMVKLDEHGIVQDMQLVDFDYCSIVPYKYLLEGEQRLLCSEHVLQELKAELD